MFPIRDGMRIGFDVEVPVTDRRMIEQDRVAHADASHLAARLWSALHGAVTLEIAGFLGDGDNGLTQVLAPMTIDLLVGMGANRARVTQSLAMARGARSPSVPRSPSSRRS